MMFRKVIVSILVGLYLFCFFFYLVGLAASIDYPILKIPAIVCGLIWGLVTITGVGIGVIKVWLASHFNHPGDKQGQ
ncbi:MAG: hypothetical protein ABSG90_11710 [Dehalococcoidia bacterium]|jgi:uncharacterized membrane protein